MSKYCLYALGGINYKNGTVSTCPRQADQLVYQTETILPSEIYNHKNFVKLRKLLYNDIWPTGCDTCMYMENNNIKSMRQDYVLDANNYFCKNQVALEREESNCKLYDCYNPNDHTVNNYGLRHVELRFSSACNFACLHCSEVFSSGWSKKLASYQPDDEDVLYDLKQLLQTEHRHGSDDNNKMSLSVKESLSIVEDLNSNFPNVTYIDFAGGEVLYQKQFFPVLAKLAEHPNASNIHISFHTNFNVNFDIIHLTDLLSKFGKSSIIISIDAGKSFYSYFRHGGKWDTLVSNIQTFTNHNTFTYIDASCTTSIYQMLDIYDIFESFLELNIGFDCSIVQSPLYLDPSLIMYDFKNETLCDISRTYDLINKYSKRKTTAEYWLDYIVDYVTKTKIGYQHYNRWLIYRKKSDQIWNQNFNNFFKNYYIENNELKRKDIT